MGFVDIWTLYQSLDYRLRFLPLGMSIGISTSPQTLCANDCAHVDMHVNWNQYQSVNFGCKRLYPCRHRDLTPVFRLWVKIMTLRYVNLNLHQSVDYGCE